MNTRNRRAAEVSLLLVAATLLAGFAGFPATALAQSPTASNSYEFSWTETSNFTVVEYWNAPDRAGCSYATSPWPQAQLAAQRAYVLGARQVLRDEWAMNSWIKENRASTSQVRIHGAETNCPNGHIDFPPHVHIFYLSLDANGGWRHINSHHYTDSQGKIWDNSIIPNLCGQTKSYHPAADQWVDILDETCAAAWQQRYTSGGDLELKRPGSSSVYALRSRGTNGDLSSLDVLLDGQVIYSIDIVEYDPIAYRMAATIRDHRKNVIATERWGGDPGQGANLVSHTSESQAAAPLSPWISLPLVMAASGQPGPGPEPTSTTFAVVGDYGTGDANETAVADLVKSWGPAFIVSTGDGYRAEAGGSGDTRFDESTGKDYCTYLAGISTSGTRCPQPGPSSTNRFFPALGNHDYWDAGERGKLPATYTSYFRLPGDGVAGSGTSGNERYYDFVQGPVHFFVLNSNNDAGEEPDGTTSSSRQGTWLREQLAASTSPWKVILAHHPPHSSGSHGSNSWMQWPFAQWGADVVIAGHDHNYERIIRDGIVYFVNGTGGAPLYNCGTPVEGSQHCADAQLGAQRVKASDSSLEFESITVDGSIRDTHHLEK